MFGINLDWKIKCEVSMQRKRNANHVLWVERGISGASVAAAFLVTITSYYLPWQVLSSLSSYPVPQLVSL